MVSVGFSVSILTGHKLQQNTREIMHKYCKEIILSCSDYEFNRSSDQNLSHKSIQKEK